MRKHSALFVGMLFVGLILTACGDKTEEAAFANYTVEQNKVKIQDDGLATMEKLNGMTDLTGVYAMRDFSFLVQTSSLAGDPVEIALSRIIAPLTFLDKDVLGLTNLRSASVEINNLSEIFPQVGGIYVYNPMTEEFVREANTTKIEVQYPIGNSTTNNGKLLINNLSISTAANATTNIEMPKSLDIVLSKDGQALISYEYRATYNAVNEPTTLNMGISFVEGYDFTETFVHSNTEVSLEMKYTLNNANILSGKFNTVGNFTTAAMYNESNLEDEAWINQVLDNANAYIQLGNLKVTGVVDVNKAIAAYDVAFPDGVTESEADVDKVCTLLNENATLLVMYAKEGTIIAKSSFYKTEYSYLGYDYDTWDYVEVTGFQPSMQFLFKDGSAMDQSFFQQGFDDLQGALNEMMQAFQTNYME